LKKKKQKNFIHGFAADATTELQWIKVFCFFFSKKKRFPEPPKTGPGMRKLALLAALAAIAAWYAVAIYPDQRLAAELTAVTTRLPQGSTLTWREAHIAPLSRRVTITGLDATLPGPQGATLRIEAGTIELTNPATDLAALIPATTSPDTAIPLADSLTITDLRTTQPQATTTIARIALTQPTLYPWPLQQAGLPPLTDLVRPPNADLTPLLRLGAAAMRAFSYRDYELDSLHTTATTAEISFTQSYRHMSVSSYDRGHIQSARADGYTFARGPLGTFTADRFTLTDWDLRTPLTQIAAGTPLSPALLDTLRIGGFTFDGLTMAPEGRNPIRLGDIALANLTFAQGLPVTATLSWKGLRLTQAILPDSTSPELDLFTRLNLPALTTSLVLSYTWDLDRQRLTLTDSLLRIDELGSLTLAATFTDVSPNLARTNAIRLASARLRYDDASLVSRTLRLSSSDPETLRQQIIAALNGQGPLPAPKNPAAVPVLKALADFLAAPRALAIDLTPPRPISLASFQLLMQADDVTTIGLKVIANPP
jgi:hypothetical protein